MKPKIKVNFKNRRKKKQNPSALTPVDASNDDFRKYMKSFEDMNIQYPEVLVKEKRKLQMKKKKRFRIHNEIMKRSPTIQSSMKKIRNKRIPLDPRRMRRIKKKKKKKSETLPPIYHDSPSGFEDRYGRKTRNRTIKRLESRLDVIVQNPFNTPQGKKSFSRRILKDNRSRTLPLIRKFRESRMKGGKGKQSYEEVNLPNLNLLAFGQENPDLHGLQAEKLRGDVRPTMYFHDQSGLMLKIDKDDEEISFRAAPVKIHNLQLTQKHLEERDKQKMNIRKRLGGSAQSNENGEEDEMDGMERDEDGFEVPSEEWFKAAREEFDFVKKKPKTKLDKTMVIPLVEQEDGDVPIPPPLPQSPPTPEYMKVGSILNKFKKMSEEAERRLREKEKEKISYIAPTPPPNLTPIEVTRTYDPNNAVGSRLTPPTPPPRERSNAIFTYFNTTSEHRSKSGGAKKTKTPAFVRRKRTRTKKRTSKSDRAAEVKKVLDSLVGKDESEGRPEGSVSREKENQQPPLMKMASSRRSLKRSASSMNQDLPTTPQQNQGKFGEYDWEFKKGKFSRKLHPAYRLYAKRDKRSKLVFYEMSFSNADLRNIRLFQKTINSLHGKKRNSEIGKVY